jgi:anti-sigma regulatory factor (Ser/Thr protein kinase)
MSVTEWAAGWHPPAWVRLGLCPVCGTSVLVGDEFIRDRSMLRRVECDRYLRRRPLREATTLRGGPEIAAEAREWAAPLLSEAGPDADLLLTELVTNAVRHSHASCGQPISLVLELWPTGLRMAVTDPGPGFEWRQRAGDQPAEEGGYGLVLVDRIAQRWGIQRTSGRSTVWFELDWLESRPPHQR